MKNSKVHFSSKSDLWETPQDFFNDINREFNFNLDVCASAGNAKCPHYYSEHQNGLLNDWTNRTCWCNPPYSQLRLWFAKAAKAANYGATVVMLVPARTDTKAFHEYVWSDTAHRPRLGVEVRFIKGRLKFVGAKSSAPFPSMLLIFRPPGQ